jgi:ATP/maltotriose-dependent transcriptional regulator MalT
VLSFEQLASKRHLKSMPSLRSSDLLFDYFATEIFKNADPQTQDVLLKTAFVPWVTPSIAKKLVGRASAEEVLLRLHRQNYFTNRRLSGGEPVYEYHPLFRDFLLARAAALYAPTRRTRIRRRAAQLTEAAGDIETAAVLLRDAEDWPALASFVSRHAPTLLGQGRGETVERWLAALPDATFDEVPWVRYWRGMCWFACWHAESQRDLQQAFAAFRQRGDATGMFLAWAAIIIAYHGESNTPASDPWLARLDELRHEHPAFPSEDVEARVAAAMLSGIVFRQPARPDAPHWARRALELSHGHPDLPFRTIAVWIWFLYHFQRGDHAAAASIVDDMRALMHDRNVSPVVAVNARSTVAWYEGVVATGPYRRTVAEVLDLALSTGMFYAAKITLIAAGVFGALSDGDLETADAWTAEIKKDLPILGPGQLGWYYEFLVRAALTRGDVREAALHQPEMLRLGLAAGWCLNDAAVLLVSAQVNHLCGDTQAAHAHLARALAIADTMRSPYVEFMARLVEAELCLDNGQEAEGLRALGSAMALGKAGGFVNSRVWQPRSMARLYARALEAGIEVDYVRDVIERRQLSRFLHAA